MRTVVVSGDGLTVEDGDCIFDVGANIGLYSVLLLRAYRRLRIFAFEPVPSNLEDVYFATLHRHRQAAGVAGAAGK
mgnify:CR=1 FL=1